MLPALRFGAVQIHQATQVGTAAHFNITVTKEDRDAFLPNVIHFDEADHQAANTAGDAWQFTVGVEPSRKLIRLIPGHIEKTEEDTFAGYGPHSVYGADRYHAYPLIQKIHAQLTETQAAIKQTLSKWLG